MNKHEDQIIAFLSEPNYRPIDVSALSKKLGIGKKGASKFQAAVDELVQAGRIREGKKGRLQLKTAEGFVTGVVKKISSGSAFLIPHETSAELGGKDVYIDARDLKDAHTGDEVLVRLTSKRRSGGQRCGTVESVVERANHVFVGTYYEKRGQGHVRVDGDTFHKSIHVGDPGAKGAKADDKVVIEMLRFPTADQAGEAVLTEVLGHRGDPGVDTMTVVHSLGLPHEFSEAALDDARVQADRFSESNLNGRLDLTRENIVTIDPATARDFDDAISLRRDKRGHWQLGVHIADVAHFVTPGSALEKEGRDRGTSVYLPRHVIPMLPEIISNGLASLQEGQVRYTKSVFIEFDKQGRPQGAELANTVIKVSKRFAYEQVMPIIRTPKQHAAETGTKVVQLLLRMHELAMLLRKNRFEAGALQMGIPEIEIDFDDDGNVIGAHERHHDESHEIIEEFMLAANVAVAQILASKDIPFLRRVHGYPDELRLKNFQEFCGGLGYDLEKFQSRKDIQQVIHDVEGKPEQRAINFALLRSMKQAEYSPEDLGHYALNEEDYCHFTSPIRRFPDLTIHRVVGDLAAGKKPTLASMAELVQLGKHCSLTERRAERAERELKKIKLLRYMSTRVGEEMDAFVTGVESFGMFCQGVSIPAEGLIHISALADDFYTYEQASRTLTGDRTKKQYRLGDLVRVVIARVDIDRRQLDLRLSDKQPPKPEAARGRQASPAKQRPTSSSARPKKKNASQGRRAASKTSVAKSGEKGGRTTRRRKR